MKYKNLIFIHDGPIYFDGKDKYYEYSYPHLKERYETLSQNISFMMRVFPLTSETRGNAIPENVRIIPIANLGDIKRHFRNKKKAKKIIKESLENVDIVIIRGSLAGHLALRYIKKKNIPYIYECVGCMWDAYWNHGIIGKILAPYMFLTTRRIISKSEYVYYVTNKFLQKRYPTKGISVGCSNVYLEKVNEEVLNKRLRRNTRLLEKKHIILGTAAAIDVKYKGQEYVIKAIPNLLSKGYEVEYWLAGGNRKKSKHLENVAKKYGVSKNVKFFGSLNSEEIKDFYDEIDIYIQPSKQEGLPRSLIEAMSRGCLALGSSIAGIPELLGKEFLFKPGKSKEISNAIEHILKVNVNEVSERNFNIAKQYEKEYLENKRKLFYTQFLKFNNKK